MSTNSSQPLYLDDLTTGQRFTSAARQVDTGQIESFARQYDPQCP